MRRVKVSQSQQPAVLRRAGTGSSWREGTLVVYALSTPDMADLPAAGRRILSTILTARDGLRERLRVEGVAR